MKSRGEPMTDPRVSSGTRLLVAIAAVVAGTIPLLAAFDLGPVGHEAINGPPWLAAVAGGVFIAGGLAVALGTVWPWVGPVVGILVMLGLAALGNWIAFGAGERVCSGSIDFLWMADRELSGLGCRIPFGLGAVIVDALLFYAVVHQLQVAWGGPPRLARLQSIAGWMVMAALAPILLPLALVLVGRAGMGAIAARIRTGEWPQNSEFFRRRRPKR